MVKERLLSDTHTVNFFTITTIKWTLIPLSRRINRENVTLIIITPCWLDTTKIAFNFQFTFALAFF